ncbi:MAG: serpin family protein [Planctomycetes bacterium]|nr:serpin family protein [Planctomycetota bacterium]
MSRTPLALVLAALIAPVAAAQEEEPVRELAAAHANFACDLYRTLASPSSDDIFFSPHSISAALEMTWAGARGDTAAEMARALSIGALGDRVHGANGALAAELARRERPADPEQGGEPFRLRVSNALWGQAGYEFRPDFLELLSSRYGAVLRILDFQADTEAARKTINAEISKATEEKIPELLLPPDVTRDVRLVLTNAIYFKASWNEPFREAATENGPFTLLDGSKVEVPIMRRTDWYPSFQEDGFQAIEIPYVGEEIAMTIFVPAAGKLGEFERGLTGERLSGLLARLADEGHQVALGLPRFEVRSRFALKDALLALGMKKAFVFGEADFSGMNGNHELYVGGVIHEAFVKVDEKGTEAAAATAVMMRAGGVPPRPIALTIDRPFVYLVRDRGTGAVLFMGRVVDPR